MIVKSTIPAKLLSTVVSPKYHTLQLHKLVDDYNIPESLEDISNVSIPLKYKPLVRGGTYALVGGVLVKKKELNPKTALVKDVPTLANLTVSALASMASTSITAFAASVEASASSSVATDDPSNYVPLTKAEAARYDKLVASFDVWAKKEIQRFVTQAVETAYRQNKYLRSEITAMNKMADTMQALAQELQQHPKAKPKAKPQSNQHLLTNVVLR